MRKLSEAEWISRFEQVQGRKPKPDELQLAYQSGLIGISKNYNYIYILLGGSSSDRRWYWLDSSL
ncbi:MAG: hypothetical protein ACLS9T_06895 [Streptococcus salivarius]